MPRKPDFICIGAQKTGTTWLYKMLSKHPTIWMPRRRKEVHYFDREILSRPISWYEGLFDDPNSATTVAGEKTPNYAHLKARSIAFIRQLAPNVKIILILRRPDERSWSQARMEISRFNKRVLGPRDVWRCVFNLGTLRNSRLTRYDRMLPAWRRHFSEDRMLVLFHEEIEQDPTATIQKVASFIGVSDCTHWQQVQTDVRVWASPVLEIPAAVRWYLQRRYRAMLLRLAREYPVPVEQWLRPGPVDAEPSLWEKFRVWFIADVCTIPFNIAYWCYDAVRDVRMAWRLRALSHDIANSPSTNLSSTTGD